MGLSGSKFAPLNLMSRLATDGSSKRGCGSNLGRLFLKLDGDRDYPVLCKKQASDLL